LRVCIRILEKVKNQALKNRVGKTVVSRLQTVDYLLILRGINRNKITEKGHKTEGITKRVGQEMGYIHHGKITGGSYALAEVPGSG